MKTTAGQTRIILDPTFQKLASEAVDKGHEATRAYFSLKSEDRTAAAANVLVRTLKEADAPLWQYVLVHRMRAKAWKHIKLMARLERRTHA